MNQEQIGKFIAELRKEKELTQMQLGEKLGVTNKTISRWENGNYMPDISLMQRLCAELGVGVNELLSGKRLDEVQFREKADDNMILTLAQIEVIRREKRIYEFLSGAGTGLLVSTLHTQDSVGRVIIIVVSLGMIGYGWFRRDRIDKRFLGEFPKESCECYADGGEKIK